MHYLRWNSDVQILIFPFHLITAALLKVEQEHLNKKLLNKETLSFFKGVIMVEFLIQRFPKYPGAGILFTELLMNRYHSTYT